MTLDSFFTKTSNQIFVGISPIVKHTVINVIMFQFQFQHAWILIKCFSKEYWNSNFWSQTWQIWGLAASKVCFEWPKSKGTSNLCFLSKCLFRFFRVIYKRVLSTGWVRLDRSFFNIFSNNFSTFKKNVGHVWFPFRIFFWKNYI